MEHIFDILDENTSASFFFNLCKQYLIRFYSCPKRTARKGTKKKAFHAEKSGKKLAANLGTYKNSQQIFIKIPQSMLKRAPENSFASSLLVGCMGHFPWGRPHVHITLLCVDTYQGPPYRDDNGHPIPKIRWVKVKHLLEEGYVTYIIHMGT